MEIVKANKQGVEAAVLILKQGGVIVYPTETAYGLGADFLNPKAVRKVYQIKGRNFKKPLSVIVSSLKMAREYVKFSQKSLSLAKKWPGPLTLVLSQIKGNKTLGLRISSNRLATTMVKKIGGPITSTSANISTKKSCYSVNEVINQFKNKKFQPDLIIDAGQLPNKKVSKVVKVLDNKVKVLRK